VHVSRCGAGASRRHETLAFPSPLPSGIGPNDTVLVHRYRANAASQGTILFHHPAFRTGLAWIDWFTRPLRERFDVAVMEVPYHLSRAPEGTFSGERLINPNPIHLYEGLRQWMADQRALLAILEAEAAVGDPRARPVALVGYSLGAYLSMLYTRFDPALPVVAICGTNDYAMGVFEGILTTSLRACIESAGISREDWERLTRTLKLHLHAHELPADRFLLLSARYDRVEPFRSIERLIEALRPRRSVILPSGHSTTAVLFRRRIMNEAMLFIDELGGEARKDGDATRNAGRGPDGGLARSRARLSS
jgi:hypothetical protein